MNITMGKDIIACIVLNWNSGPDTINCIRSLLESEDVVVRILVIDNGSSDGPDRLLKEAFPDITILRNSTNLGVAKAWNIGVRWSVEQGSGLIFFLNNDAVVEKHCLSGLKQTIAETPNDGIVSPRIMDGNHPGTIWFDGGFINAFGDTVHRGGSASRPSNVAIKQDFATGCAMLVKAEVFNQTGLFNESYFAYSEDADLCFRARAGGFNILHNSVTCATHSPSATTIRNRGKWFRDYYVTRNKLLLVRSHVAGIRWALFLLYYVVQYVVVPVVYFSITGQWKRVVAVFRGVRDFAFGRFGGRYT